MTTPQPRLLLNCQPVGPWPVSAYVLICPQTRQSMLVDPGADPEALLAALAGSEPVGILITHTHEDHIGALEAIRSRLGVPVMAHPGPHIEGVSLAADHRLADGDRVQVGRHSLRVYHTPGHTDDLICLALWDDDGGGDQRVLVGDAIFEGGPGHTRSSADFGVTRCTLRQVILRWPDDALCHPGHGTPFRLGDIRPAIEAFLAKDHGDFYGDATWEM